MYTRNGENNSDDQEEYGYRQRGIGFGDADDVQEHGFEPRQQVEDDIFIFKNTELPGIPKTERIRKLVVSQEAKILVTQSNKLYRWRTRVDAQFKGYDLPQTSKENFLGFINTKERSATVKNIYIDPKGWHCLIAGQGGINYYLNYRQSKVKILKELKGVNLKAVSFHGAISETKSGDILISIDGGILVLYRIQLEQNGEVREQSALQYQLYLTNEVISIQILKLTQSNGRNYVVVVLFTNSSMVSFTGPDDLEPLIISYKNQTEKLKEFQMPKTYQTMYQICYSKLLKRPTAILWVNNNAIIRIKIPDADEQLNQNFLGRSQALKWAKRADQPDNKAYQVQQMPINIGISDFHYYLLFQDSITILSSVTQKLVIHEEFKGNLVSDMAYEKSTGIFWIFSNKGVIKLDTNREGNEAWKLLLQQKRFKQAYQVCVARNENVSYVAGIYGDYLFSNKQYEKAAEYFSKTSRTFEEIFLKFLQINSDEARDGLQLYLKSWLKRVKPDEKSQRCLLVSWLIQLMIYRLNRLERAERQSEGESARRGRQKLKEKQKQLEDLLVDNLNYVNQQLVYLVMQSHGRIQNLINFADKKNNFEMIIMHYLSQEAYQKALQYLKNVKDPKVVDVVYKYAHIFFRYETEKTVTLLTKSIRQFKPIKLMPGLMNIPDNKRVYGIELLRYCVEELKSRDKSLHNILIFFYATSPKQKHSQLIELMRKGRLQFDLDFGLRLFRNYKMAEAQIIVYGKMYLYGDAVALALEHNKEDLAKEYADKPEYEDERKKLWIEIAKHYLIKKGKISEVIELTKQSKVVKIEDLLPHFNQNIKIENFKDEICESLKSYSAEIGRLKSLMDSYSANAQQLKNELRMVKNRCIEIDSSHKCEECFKTLFSQEFYIFPCMHGFHRNCLQTATSAHSTSGSLKLREVEALSQDIRALQQRIIRKRQDQKTVKDTAGGFSFMNALSIWNSKKDEEGGSLNLQKQEAQLKAKKSEIDNILAAQCLYCGPGIVDTITMPFDNEVLRESWKI